MSDEDRKFRKSWKAAITRHINNLEVHMAEEDVSGMKDRLEKLKNAYKKFETAHEKYHEEIKEEEEQESEKYFRDVQRSYIDALNPARAWLKEHESQVKPPPDSSPGVEVKTGVEKSSESTVNHAEISDLIGLLNLPKVELKSFDGNPMNFHCFITLFEECVKSVNDENLKLTRLLQYTTGRAHEAIQSCVLLEDGYRRAREILLERFGNNHLVAEMIVSRIRRGKPVRSAEEMQDLADELNNSRRTLSQIKCLHEVDNQSCISEISKRLEYRIQDKWINRVMDVKRSTNAYPDFKEFVDFVTQQAQRANDPIYGHSRSRRNDVINSKPTSLFTSELPPSDHVVKFPCVLCSADHKLFGCDVFRKMRPIERLEVVNKYKLCENCLMSNHTTQMCRRPTRCSVPDCNKKHTKFIHISNWSGASTSETADGQDSSNARDGVRMIHASVSTNSEVHMPVVAVTVNHSKDVCALLDTGSSNSFISKPLADSLGLGGNVVTYSLNTLSGEQSVKSHAVNINLSSLDGAESLELCNVYVVDNIPVLTSNLKLQDYGHFRGLQLVDGGQEVQVLIGQDNAEALIPLEVRRGKRGDPFATRTLFGWSISGPDAASGSVNKRVHSHFVSALSMEDEVKQLWEIEGDAYTTEQAMSQDDRKVLDVWARDMKFVNGHFQLPIPWKEDATIPNNYSAAAARLASLLKSLKRKGLMKRYNDEIVKLLDKGYAEPVNEDGFCTPRDIWYLPHHPVITDKKPDKLRIVFDCAAKFKGESLNDKCLQGPDLNNKLLHVLLRFRQHEYAFTADIESMYYQVKIPVEQRDILRFLWLDNNGNICQYRMTGHVFGGVWCASSTCYALRQSLVSKDVDKNISDTILRSFYVDDCLKSVEERSDVICIIDGTKKVLGDSGFNLTKFMVNDNDLLQHIPLEHRAVQAKDLNPSTCSKVLGIKWNVATDEFYFDIDVTFESKVTKRSMLSIVASMYDPLGFINPLILSGKMMFQEATFLDTWDKEAPEELASRWLAWLKGLEGISELRIPRCVKPNPFNDAAMELHIFSDSSERAYGSCCYLRLVNKDGSIHTSLLLAKSRVTPRKFISIPRLELQAAVLSVQLDNVLRRELDVPLTESYFWTDSEIVLKYIANDSRRLQVFVANRVSAIRQSTDPSQWHHIAGMDNPADLLTRAQDLSNMNTELWLEGPRFLRTHKCDWNSSCIDPTLTADDPEVKKAVKETVNTFLTSGLTSEDPMDKLIAYYSEWSRLLRAVAWLLRAKGLLSKKNTVPKGRGLSLAEVKQAEITVIRHVQAKCYSRELITLTAEGRVDRNSSIKELSPLLDENGIIRVNGRIKYAQVSRDARQPYVIPHSHPAACLIVRHHHNEAHLGTEWIVSKVREHYWITKIRSVVKSVAHACVTCKKLFASTSTQRLADLPL